MEECLGLPGRASDGLLQHNAAGNYIPGDDITISQDQRVDRRSKALVVHSDHSKADRQAIMETGADDGCRLAILVRHECRRGYCSRLEMPSGIIVFFRVIATVITRILVEVHMSLVPIIALDVSIAIAVMAQSHAKAVVDG